MDYQIFSLFDNPLFYESKQNDMSTLSSANSYTDTAITNLTGTAPAVLDTLGEIAQAINDDANVYTTLVGQIAAVQSDVDGNEADADSAIAAESSARAAAVSAVQADVDQNEADADAADAALSGRLDVLEADPTTATALAAVREILNIIALNIKS